MLLKILICLFVVTQYSQAEAASDRGSALQYKREMLQKMNKGGFSDIDKYIQNKNKEANTGIVPGNPANIVSVQVPEGTQAAVVKFSDSLITPPAPPIRTMQEAANAGINPMAGAEPAAVASPIKAADEIKNPWLAWDYWKNLPIVPAGIGISSLLLFILILKKRKG